jgi:CubicO group peptidase (beta-lactamase class C family)
MKTPKLIPALLGLLLCSFPYASAAPVIDATAQAKIDQTVGAAIAKHLTPSCCVVIGTSKDILFAKAYGHLTYDQGSPAATLDTLYDMASCSKAVGTTSATALLLQDGKLNLDDPVSKYLPSWNRDDKRTITIRNLATHTSGLPAYTSADAAEAGRAPGESHADALIKHIAALPLQYKTNEDWLYACLNFLTLARVNEEVAGTSQERFLRARLFTPLGMSDSGYYLRRAKKLLCAPTIGGASFRQGVVHDPLAYYYRDGYHCPGNAGLFTTANDLSKFCRMVLSGGRWGDKQIFAPQTIDLFFTDQIPAGVKTTRGIGWGISQRPPYATSLNAGPKTACISHSGYTGTFIELDRLAGTFMVILTNRVYPSDSTSIGDIIHGVRQTMIETDPIYREVLLPSKRP